MISKTSFAEDLAAGDGHVLDAHLGDVVDDLRPRWSSSCWRSLMNPIGLVVHDARQVEGNIR
jgi:hypothetical protein